MGRGRSSGKSGGKSLAMGGGNATVTLSGGSGAGGLDGTTPGNGSDNDIIKSALNMNDDDFLKLLKTRRDDFDLMLDGLNNNATQATTDLMGLNQKPTVLSDADWDKKVQTDALGGETLWRGVEGTNRLSAEDISNNLRNSDKTFIGNGIHGNGLYFTTDKSYAKNLYSDGTKGSLTQAFIDKGKAMVVKEKTLRDMQRSESKKAMRDMDLSTYAIRKGYNVIAVPGGNFSRSSNGDFYVALSRSVLVIRNHTE